MSGAIYIFWIVLGIRKIAPQKIPSQKIAYPPRKLIPMKIPPYEYSLNLPPRKLPPEKINPSESPSPLINHTNERKNKITNIFALKKAAQCNILTYWA